MDSASQAITPLRQRPPRIVLISGTLLSGTGLLRDGSQWH
jgi:hypothetical protein